MALFTGKTEELIITNKGFAEGVRIISNHMPADAKEDCNLSVEHDQLWYGMEEWITDENDRALLEQLGWFINEQSWCFWV